MTELTFNECARWLEDRDHFVILTHRKPDGDTIGSSAALCLALRAMGKTAYLLENPEVTQLFAPLVEGLTKAAPQEGDVLIAVDVAADNMLPKAFECYKNNIDLRIDHHGSGREYSPAELVDSSMAACAEIIWELLADLDVEMDAAIAEAIYVGTATDTGCFRFANTTAHTFDVAGDCAAVGADIYNWNQKLFDTKSLPKLRLQGWIIDHVQFLEDGKLAICCLPRSVEEEIGVSEDDMNDISSFLRSIEGVRMSALLRETEEGRVKISVRAIPGSNAAAVCETFGGGGHAGAAGCNLRMTMEQAAQAIGKVMLEY